MSEIWEHGDITTKSDGSTYMSGQMISQAVKKANTLGKVILKEITLLMQNHCFTPSLVSKFPYFRLVWVELASSVNMLKESLLSSHEPDELFCTNPLKHSQ